jgi:putrescine transport system ATP-binding protein
MDAVGKAPRTHRPARRKLAPWSDPAARPLIRLERVSKRFGEVAAVADLSLDIFAGEFFALLGPSGCGKTTLMRLIAGFETPDAGRIVLAGEDLAGVPPYRRPVNMMFQSYALFPHLSVHDNVAFGLKQEGMPKPEIEGRVADMLKLVELEGLERRKPDQLSGGQRQRVALARSLAKHPKVLLLDEPLAALDKKLRAETQFELVGLQRRLGTTFVIVTHDQEEAMTVADRIAVMDRGRIVQIGPPAEIYEQPNSRYVAEFVGDVNLIEAKVAARNRDGLALATPLFDRPIRVGAARAKVGDVVWLALRPEKIAVAAGRPRASGVHAVAGKVEDIGYLGDVSTYHVRLENGALFKVTKPNLSRAAPFAAGDRVWLAWAPNAGVVLTR